MLCRRSPNFYYFHRNMSTQSSSAKKLVDFLTDADWNSRSLPKFTDPLVMKQNISDVLKISENGLNEEDLLKACKKIYNISVSSNSPRFYNQLFGDILPEAMLGAMLTDFINTSSYTYEIAPVMILMEKELIQFHLNLANFPDGSEGVFAPGGSMANMYGINLARHRKNASTKAKGLYMYSSSEPRIYVSSTGHYSISKGAAFMGMGTNAVVSVPCDKAGKMNPEELKKRIIKDKEAGLTPLVVVATAATTVFGNYDPIHAIADICEQENVWMHIDGCLGASALVSKKLSHYMQGCERADSMTWNPHKLMGIPLQCSMLLTKHAGLLQEAHGYEASYLFQKDKPYPLEYDTGDNVIQCGRRADVLKLWSAWQGMGRNGYAEYMEKKFQLAQIFAQKIEERTGKFELLTQPESVNILFYVIPPSVRHLNVEDTQRKQKLHEVAPVIKERMMRKGSMLVGYQIVNGTNCWRMVTSQAKNTESDIDEILDEFEQLSEGL